MGRCIFSKAIAIPSFETTNKIFFISREISVDSIIITTTKEYFSIHPVKVVHIASCGKEYSNAGTIVATSDFSRYHFGKDVTVVYKSTITNNNPTLIYEMATYPYLLPKNEWYSHDR